MAIFRGALPADDFAIVANHWFRDPRLSGKAKGYMGYIATHAPKYRLTVEQLICEMKESKDAVYAGLGELVDFEYLVRTQGNSGGSFGDVDYHFGPAAYEQKYVRAWTKAKADKLAAKKAGKTVEAANIEPGEDVSAGQTASGKPGSGPDQGKQGVSAGQTASGFSGSAKPASGKAETKKYQGSKEDQGLEDQGEENPPTPRAADAAGAAASPGREGDSFDEETRDKLNAAIEGAAAERSDVTGWSLGAIRKAVRDALGAGHPADLVASSLPLLAGDRDGTEAPGRLRHYLAAQARAAAETDTPDWAKPSVTYLDPDRARCAKHRDYPADNCAQCRIDDAIAKRETADDAGEPAPPLPGQKGRAAYLAARAALDAARGGKAAVEAGRVPDVDDQGADVVDRDAQLAELEQFGAQLADAAA